MDASLTQPWAEGRIFDILDQTLRNHRRPLTPSTSTISSRVLQVYLEKSITLSHTHDRDPNAGGVKVGVVVYEGLTGLSPGRVQD